jgi:hypothetical protein
LFKVGDILTSPGSGLKCQVIKTMLIPRWFMYTLIEDWGPYKKGNVFKGYEDDYILFKRTEVKSNKPIWF